MITLIHGDMIEASRAELTRLKKESKAQEVRLLDGKGLDEAILTQALESQSMFGGETLIIIENLFGKLGKKVKLIESLCRLLVSASSSADIVLWEDKEVGVTVQKNLGNAVVKLYKTPQLLFQFLDGIKPKAAATLLPVFQKLVTSTVPEIVFVMITRRVRQLIQLADGVQPDGLQAWQAGRLTAQGRAFTIDKLVAMHAQLVAIDIGTKTGSSPFTLAQQLEQFIVSL